MSSVQLGSEDSAASGFALENCDPIGTAPLSAHKILPDDGVMTQPFRLMLPRMRSCPLLVKLYGLKSGISQIPRVLPLSAKPALSFRGKPGKRFRMRTMALALHWMIKMPTLRPPWMLMTPLQVLLRLRQ